MEYSGVPQNDLIWVKQPFLQYEFCWWKSEAFESVFFNFIFFWKELWILVDIIYRFSPLSSPQKMSMDCRFLKDKNDPELDENKHSQIFKIY